ncbi:MAG: hypothetical protein CM1200mP15_00870 [Dehalococcoidia bacterium]|nr:MAG: hypothetical protein CM1200mP15_00870 [Dehalococcoidia bacterium]
MAEERPEYQRGMVVVAHADDAEWGCSGTVAKWCAQGWEVVMSCVPMAAKELTTQN